jgi:hypothetical protein
MVKGSHSIANAYDTDAHVSSKRDKRDSGMKASDFTSPRILNSYDSIQAKVKSSPYIAKKEFSKNKLNDSDIRIVTVPSKNEIKNLKDKLHQQIEVKGNHIARN